MVAGEREEDRQLWRDTQRQINELSTSVVQLSETVDRIGHEFREADRRWEQRIEQLAQESRAEDHRLGQRIDALVTAIGQITVRFGILPQQP